ncbi:ribonucleotide-diphosphate reductase subunit beta [bacterium]|nr:ribonucleotide-diphosphate reductase subunit beta [bacterium]
MIKDVKPIFNTQNTEWKTSADSLILGQQPALIDSINRKHPKLFNLYKRQKAVDWSEDEVDLAKSLLDFNDCPEHLSDIMVENISFQWETDSIAANSMLSLLAPVITNSDFSIAVTKNTEIENLHALTYSEIVKLAIPNPDIVFDSIMGSSYISERNDSVTEQLTRFKWFSFKYALGEQENNAEMYKESFLALVAFYCLERLQFMSSFAYTFMVVEEDYFQGIGKLVQKIMQDEYYHHAPTMRYAIKHEMFSERGMSCWAENKEIIQELVDTVVKREYDWNAHIGYKSSLVNKWAEYNAQEIYDALMLDLPFNRHDVNPLPMMDKWLDIDSFQNANQEGDNNNYSLNSFRNDTPVGKKYNYY